MSAQVGRRGVQPSHTTVLERSTVDAIDIHELRGPPSVGEVVENHIQIPWRNWLCEIEVESGICHSLQRVVIAQRGESDQEHLFPTRSGPESASQFAPVHSRHRDIQDTRLRAEQFYLSKGTHGVVAHHRLTPHHAQERAE